MMKRQAANPLKAAFVWSVVSLVLLTFAAVPAGASDLEWLSDVDQAMAAAAKGDRYILVDLYAEWCGWCKVLEEKVFTTAEFAAFVKEFVLLRVDVEDGGQGSQLQIDYNAASLPTTLILDSDGVRVGAVAGFAPTPQFVQHLKDAIQRYDASLEIYKKLRTSDDAALLSQLATELHERRDGARAAEIYERMEQMKGHNPTQTAWLHYRLADARRMQGEYGRAEENLAKARSIITNIGHEGMREQLDMLSFHVAQDRGDCREAMNRLENFLQNHPRSEMRFQVNKTLQKLRKSDGENC